MTPGAIIKLTSKDVEFYRNYFDRELPEALENHAATVEEPIRAWDALYRAEPTVKRRTFPWPGACNLVIPLVATTVDSILARIVNTIFSVDPFWTVRPLHKDFQAVAKPTEQFLEWSRTTEFVNPSFYRVVKRWTNEVVKYGWGWLKPTWEVQTRPYFLPGPDGKPVRQDQIIRQPQVHHVLAIDMIRQAGIEDEMQAEWLGQRLRLTDGQMWLRWRDAIYKISREEMENVLRTKADAGQVHDDLAGGSDVGMRSAEKLNTIYELACDLPIPSIDPRVPVSTVMQYHLESRTILRAIYNPDAYGRRSQVKGLFVEYEGRSQGIGVCPMLADLQDELGTVHRQQVDNATLANTRFFVGRRGQIRPGTMIHPGKVIITANPKEDFVPFQMGDIYNSMHNLEASIMAFAEKRSGVTDYQLGRESSVAGSRATATGTLAIIQEGNRRFDLNVRDMRDALAEVGKRVLQLNQQFRPKGVAYFVQGEDGQLTEDTLNLPQEYIDHRLGVELSASTAVINREVEKQGLIALVGLLTQHLQMGQQAAMIVGNPQVSPIVQEYTARGFQGLNMLMKQVVERFEQKDVDALVPTLMAEMQANGAGAFVGGGLGGGLPGPGGNGAMAGVPGMAQGAVPGGAPPTGQLQ